MKEREVNFVLRPELNMADICKNKQICKICKGLGCCQLCGCAWSPDDFYVTKNFANFTEEEQFRYLKKFIKRGYTSIEYWNFYDEAEKMVFMKGTVPKDFALSNHGAFYLRSRNVGAEIVDIIHLIDETEKPCILWSEETGCKLSYSKRPKGGKMVIPNQYEGCPSLYKEEQSAIDWYPFQEVLYQLYCYFKKNRY